MSATRFTLYPSISTDTERVLRDVRITRGDTLLAGINHYEMKVGVAYGGRVDYAGTYDGLKYDLSADVPFSLIENGDVRVPAKHSVVLDVEPFGLPPSLEGTTVTATVRHAVTDPTHRVHDPVARAALEVMADHLNLIRAADETVSIVLPPYIQRWGATGEYHETSSTPQTPNSATFVNGLVSVTVAGTQTRPVAVMLTAHASVEGVSGAPDTMAVAISDGTTDQNEQRGGSAAVIGELYHVSTSYATQVTTSTTFTIRFKDISAPGSNQVNYQSITAITSEI